MFGKWDTGRGGVWCLLYPRFVSVTDRFLAELGPVAQGQVPKDLDMKYENLVKGLRHVQIKVGAIPHTQPQSHLPNRTRSGRRKLLRRVQSSWSLCQNPSPMLTASV